ncbi:MAG TPA: STAS/SEC14 domain-containing protein [Gemmatimonadota bacterium]|nr:STAS/SEC14 domain-containing protein [Gemmatimonadota bacterium]
MIEIDQRSGGRVIGLRATGKIASAELKQVLERLERTIAEHGKVRLLVHVENLGTFSPGAFKDDARFSLEHAADVERVAVVADGLLFGTYVKAAAKFVPGEVRRFKTKELDEAWRWLEE